MVCSRSLLNMEKGPPDYAHEDGGAGRPFQWRPPRGGGFARLVPLLRVYAFSIVQSKGCWLSLEYSFTCATLDSATSRVKTPQTPRPRVCTWSMICVAFSAFMAKKRISTSTTKSIGV